MVPGISWFIGKGSAVLICEEEDTVLMAFPMIPKGCIRYGRVCEFYDYCLAWKNPLQRCDKAPLGFKVQYWDPTEKTSKHQFEFGKGGQVEKI